MLENTCTLMASLLLGSTVSPPALLTTTRICLAKSLELPIRKSEKAVCWRQGVINHYVCHRNPVSCTWGGGLASPRLTPA